MILQTFQGYLYIISKSVWKVRLAFSAFSVATAVKAIVYNNVKGENNNDLQERIERRRIGEG